jgi:tRNA (cmo5U34)-methyltransferase
MNYTLQFIDPLRREKLIRKIYEGLNHNGILLVSDKTLQSHTDLSRIFVDNYYNLKRANGYSELEISRKREALENVLIPYPIKEEERLFRDAGFEAVDLFYTWYNFSSFVCLKKG